MKKQILIFLYNGFSDWEIAYITPEIHKNPDLELVYFSETENIIYSTGGMGIVPNKTLNEIDINNVEMIILPGGLAIETGENSELELLLYKLNARGKTIAAICGATIYLAKLGMLNNVKHTSNDLKYLKHLVPTYTAESNYMHMPAVTSGNIITASGIAPIEFAKEVFLKLELYKPEEVEQWFILFKHGVWKR